LIFLSPESVNITVFDEVDGDLELEAAYTELSVEKDRKMIWKHVWESTSTVLQAEIEVEECISFEAFRMNMARSISIRTPDYFRNYDLISNLFIGFLHRERLYMISKIAIIRSGFLLALNESGIIPSVSVAPTIRFEVDVDSPVFQLLKLFDNFNGSKVNITFK
jgi:hypothetical protein